MEQNIRIAAFRKKNSSFDEYLDGCYYDQQLFFQAMSQQNETSYFFIGDMRKKVFYISDNMRDDFGFNSNLVPEFLREWEERIVSEKSRKCYRNDHDVMLKEKRCVHDLRYRVRDVEGKHIWVRCYGILKWNEDKSQPLFFAGRITRQETTFVVDPVTNFPRTSVMIQKLEDFQKKNIPVSIIGFSFNNITEINNTKGRAYSDHLVRMIADELMGRFTCGITFYCLDGMRYVAIVEEICTVPKEQLIEEIRGIVSKWYHLVGIEVEKSCSFASMEYSMDSISSEDFLEQNVFLIKVAKHNGNMLYEEYTRDNVRKLKHMSKLKLELSRDVMHGMKYFRIVIQPVVSGKDEKIVGGEVLLRWKYEGQNISPAIFILMPEKSKQICTVGRWGFEQTVRMCLRLGSVLEDFYLTFNVSIQQLSDEGVVAYMGELLEKYDIMGACLVVEITENFMEETPEKMVDFIKKCRNLGILMALDDFGNEYSSLRRLLHYPTEIIKLDRFLMKELMEAEEKKNFISSIVYACHKFGKKVCIEGVETAKQKKRQWKQAVI